MQARKKLMQAFCEAVNALKRTALNAETLDISQYLGGDLGIDSIEMLEIWFRIEKALEIRIADDDKRDIYTVGEVLNVVERCMLASAGAAHV